MSETSTAVGASRRQRVRAATVAEIKQRAWRQIAEGGPAALSLRSLARDMGMTGSAIYRYYASRDELLLDLVHDGFAWLADALEAAESRLGQTALGAGPEECWLTIARAYRRWAQEHPSQYTLMFGARVELEGNELVRREHRRGVAVLFRAMAGWAATGTLDLTGLDATVTPKLRRQLEAWRAKERIDLPPAALAACLTAWSQLHGLLMLELSFGGFPASLRPLDALFDQQMREFVARMSVRTG